MPDFGNGLIVAAVLLGLAMLGVGILLGLLI